MNINNKILLIDDKESFGGVTQHICHLINGLQNSCIEFVLAAQSPKMYIGKIPATTSIYSIDFSNLDTLPKSISSILIKQNISILHLHTSIFNTSLFFSYPFINIPIVVTRHSIFHETDFSYKELRYVNSVSQNMNKKNIKPIAVSASVCDSLVELGTDVNNISIIYNAVPFDIKSIKKTHNPPNINIVFCGRLSEEKNLFDLLKAISLLILNGYGQLIKVDIYGEGPLNKKINNFLKSENLKNHCHLKGFNSDINSILNNYDILVNTSLIEACPYSILEAMANGLPIIASNVGGNKELVQHEANGYLYTDFADLADYILRFIQNPKLIKKMGQNSINKTNSIFDFSIFLNKHLNIYESLLYD